MGVLAGELFWREMVLAGNWEIHFWRENFGRKCGCWGKRGGKYDVTVKTHYCRRNSCIVDVTAANCSIVFSRHRVFGIVTVILGPHRRIMAIH